MKKILFAVLAISAIVALNSCGNGSGHRTGEPKDFPNNGGGVTLITGNSGNYGAGLTNPMDVVYSGDIFGSFTDDQFVPVILCDGQIVWAKFADFLKKEAVFINQKLEKGCKAHVQMKVVTEWVFIKRFIIVSSIDTCPVDSKKVDSTATPAPVVKKPVRKRQVNGGCFPNEQRQDRYYPQPKRVVVQPQPCCCGTNITISGTNNAPIVIGSGNNVGDISTPAEKKEPVWIPNPPVIEFPREMTEPRKPVAPSYFD